MDNEKTIVMPSDNGNAPKVAQGAEQTKSNNKPNNGNAAKIAGAAGAGVIVGAGIAAAANVMNHSSEAEEPTHAVEAQPEENVQNPQEQDNQGAEQQPHDVPVTPVEDDFTGHDGADPVVDPIQDQDPQLTAEVGADDVQVLGVYDVQGDDGQSMQVGAFTYGGTMGAVIDVDVDGIVDDLWIDANQNGDIDPGEVQDISNEQFYMSNFAQQAEDQMQQDHYNTGYEPDFDNNADMHNV